MEKPTTSSIKKAKTPQPVLIKSGDAALIYMEGVNNVSDLKRIYLYLKKLINNQKI